MAKQISPAGVQLTLKKARELAIQELGTARGLEAEHGMIKGFFHMSLGNVNVKIRPDIGGGRRTGRLIEMVIGTATQRIAHLFDPDTLEQNFIEEEIRLNADKREELENWVDANGPEICHKEINEIWDRRART